MGSSWKLVYKAGMWGFAGMFAVAAFVVIGRLLGGDWWPLREGTIAAKIAFAIPAWLFIACGFFLLVPAVRNLRRAKTANRAFWVVALLAFPFLATYLYFASHGGEIE